MTKRIFIRIGLLMIALSALSIALDTYLLLSKVVEGVSFYSLTFRYIVVPVAFCMLLWMRLRYIGQSRKITAFCTAGFITFAYFGLAFSSVPIIMIMEGFNPADTLVNELSAWSQAGGVGEFHFSRKIKLKITAFNAIQLPLASWPLFLVLYFGSYDPRSPGGFNVLDRISTHIKKTLNSVAKFQKQVVA